MTDTTTTDTMTANRTRAADPGASDGSVCDSSFDRWHSDRDTGHDGLHETVTDASTTRWSDSLAGRDLGTLHRNGAGAARRRAGRAGARRTTPSGAAADERQPPTGTTH